MGLVALAALTALQVRFRHPVMDPWEAAMDVSGLSFSFLGSLVGLALGQTIPFTNPKVRFGRIAGWSLLAAGLFVILGHLPLAAGLALLASLLGVMAITNAPLPSFPTGLQRATALLHRPGPEICRFGLLVLLLETWETASIPSHSPARMAEIGLYALLAALAALGWAAGSHGKSPLGEVARNHVDTRLAPNRWLCAAAGLMLFFVGLAAVLYLPPVWTLDAQVGKALFHVGPRSITRLMRNVSASGGRDLLIYWIPVCLLVTRLTRGPRAFTLLAATTFGTVGLELLFKGLLGRVRPEYTHGAHFDSFPSGHTLAATILAGTLLVTYLPSCRHSWQRVLLWVGAAGWPVLMGTTRVYLGRHFFTDVVGGLLLGIAWICCALAAFHLLTACFRADLQTERDRFTVSPVMS